MNIKKILIYLTMVFVVSVSLFSVAIAANKELINENFKSSDISKWSSMGNSNFKVADDTVTKNKALAGNGSLIIGDKNWKNYEVECKIRVDNWGEQANAGILFRVLDDTHHFWLFFEGNTQRLKLRRTAGNEVTYPFTTDKLGFLPDTKKYFTLKVVVKNDTFVMYLDGENMGTYMDSSIPNGAIGISFWMPGNTEPAFFRDFKATGEELNIKTEDKTIEHKEVPEENPNNNLSFYDIFSTDDGWVYDNTATAVGKNIIEIKADEVDAVSYFGRKFLNETLEFGVTWDWEKTKTNGGDIWYGFAMRAKTPDVLAWKSQSPQYLVVFKKDCIELQKFNPGQEFLEVIDIKDKNILKTGNQKISLSIINEGDNVIINVNIDGKNIASHKDAAENAIRESGYIGFYHYGTGIKIKPVGKEATGGIVVESNVITDGTLMERTTNAIMMFVGNSNAFVRGVKTKVDLENYNITPFIESSRVMIPIRFVADNFNMEIDWDANTNSVIILDGDNKVKFSLESNIYFVGDKEFKTDIAPTIINERMYIPIRSLCNAIDKKIFWDSRGLIIISDLENIIDINSEVNLADEAVGLFR